MKNTAFALLSAAALMLAGCGKEGPAGSNGTDGTDGADAGFELFETTISVADWAGGTYVEFPAPNVTESIYNQGMVMVYIQDDFGYWNQIPSAWTDFVGFAFFWTSADGGLVGLDYDPTMSVDVDYNVRVVTMELRDYELLDEEDLVSFEALTDALSR
jgi:hypothetical protein